MTVARVTLALAVLPPAIALAVLPPAVALAQPAAERGLVCEPRADFRLGFTVVRKNGVPNALRFGGGVGLVFARLDPVALSVAAVGMFGSSEKVGHSYRVGGDVEAAFDLGDLGAAVVVSAGVHWFVSRAVEDRRGALFRGGVGFRIRAGEHLDVGFEPLAFERLPDGEGPYTPLRSRWAYEVTFLTVGYRS